MATPYTNPSKKAQKIAKVTNEFANDDKVEEVTVKAQQEQIDEPTIDTTVNEPEQSNEDITFINL